MVHLEDCGIICFTYLFKTKIGIYSLTFQRMTHRLGGWCVHSNNICWKASAFINSNIAIRRQTFDVISRQIFVLCG